MRYHRFDDLEEYRPGGHDDVVNRLLAGRMNFGIDEVSVWHGRLAPGGRSDLHVHETSVQIYVGLRGVLVVGTADQEETLDELATVVLSAGESHFIENRSDREAEVLVISAPALL